MKFIRFLLLFIIISSIATSLLPRVSAETWPFKQCTADSNLGGFPASLACDGVSNDPLGSNRWISAQTHVEHFLRANLTNPMQLNTFTVQWGDLATSARHSGRIEILNNNQWIVVNSTIGGNFPGGGVSEKFVLSPVLVATAIKITILRDIADYSIQIGEVFVTGNSSSPVVNSSDWLRVLVYLFLIVLLTVIGEIRNPFFLLLAAVVGLVFAFDLFNMFSNIVISVVIAGFSLIEFTRGMVKKSPQESK